MSSSVGGSRAGSWDQARYNLTHNDSGKKTYNSVAQSLVPGIKSDSDGIVKIKYGTSFWDYAEAVKCLSNDESIKNMNTNKLITEINKAQENPFNDVRKIKADCELDLSKFIKPKSEEQKPVKDKPCKEPQAPQSCPQPQGGNMFITNNFFVMNAPQVQQPAQPPMMEPCGFQQQPAQGGYGSQQGYNLDMTNNMFLMM